MPQQGTALLVGLDDESVDFFSSLLRAMGLEARIAASGREGLNEAQRDPPLFILAEWFLPDVSGTSLEVYLRADPFTRGTPLAFLNGASPDSLVGQLLDSGVSDKLDDKTFARVVDALRNPSITRKRSAKP